MKIITFQPSRAYQLYSIFSRESHKPEPRHATAVTLLPHSHLPVTHSLQTMYSFEGVVLAREFVIITGAFVCLAAG